MVTVLSRRALLGGAGAAGVGALAATVVPSTEAAASTNVHLVADNTTLLDLASYCTPDGSSTADHTAAIDQCFADASAAGVGVYAPGFGQAKPYVYAGAGWRETNPILIGDGYRSTFFKLGAGANLISSPSANGQPAAIQNIYLAGIATVGGYGMIRLTFTGTAQAGTPSRRIVHDCFGQDYTGAWISQYANGNAYWRIEGRVLRSPNLPATSHAWALAFAGQADASDIDITINGYLRGVKIGGGQPDSSQSGQGPSIRGSYSPPDRTLPEFASQPDPAIAIWVVPSPNVIGAPVVQDFRFSGETYESYDYRVLIADQDASTGNDFTSYDPNYAVASSGIARGLVLAESCYFSSNSAPPAGPLVFTTTPNVTYKIAGRLNGAKPAQFVKYLESTSAHAGLVAAQGSSQNIIGPFLPDSSSNDLAFTQPSNAPGSYLLDDPNGIFLHRPETFLPVGAASPVGFTPIVSSMDGAAKVGPLITSTAGQPDAVGGNDSTTVTFGNAAGYFYLPVAAATVKAGAPLWVEFDLGPRSAGSGPSAVDLRVALQYTTSGVVHRTWHVPVPASGYTRFVFPLVLREASGDLRLAFYRDTDQASVSANIGRPRIYHSRRPMPDAPTWGFAQTAAAAPPAGTAGAIPSNPAGWATVHINGTARKMPYW